MVTRPRAGSSVSFPSLARPRLPAVSASRPLPADPAPSRTRRRPARRTEETGRTFSTVANPESAFLNRELSWLAFNARVLAEARDERNPPLERLRYAAICGSNLDEFFMVRVAGVHRQIAAGVQTPGPDGLLPRQTLGLVRERTHDMLRQIEQAARRTLDDLAREGVRFSRIGDLGKRARATLRERYLAEIQPVLTPLVVDPSHPFPYLSNLSLNLAVLLGAGEGEAPDFARVKVPVGVLPRVVAVEGRLVLLEDVIAAHLGELFKGRTVLAAHPFRVTRNTDYEFEEEEAEDLLATIEDGLRRRRFGSAVRLEVGQGMPAPLVTFLQERLRLAPEDIFRLEGPLGTADLMSLPVDRPDLAFPPHVPAVPDLGDEEEGGLFDVLNAGDVLLHHPYDGFEGVLAFLEEAAADPQVLAIKQTLYRTGDDPRLLGALRKAAENGKQVVALIELKARFDEQRNISWARKLERAGAHVVYGVAGLKTHGKVTLIVRREEGGLRRYVHIGTGNYNPKTARLYTDLSLLTAHAGLGADVSELFNHLTGYAEATYAHLLVAPDTARSGLVALIDREIAHAEAGQDAWVRVKVNSLTDPGMIEALYRASAAGVRVELIVRGVCCLRPGVPGLSENIRVRSLLGRFLEHARIFAFGGAGSPEVYFGSADWMSRNLDRRVEVIAPVLDPTHRDQFLRVLATEWADQRGSWELNVEGVYKKLPGDFSAQRAFAEARHSG
ncbi:polyphosphate kinase 1 [Deinococcus sp. SDU3-2]|uniref:Polyphosphate kinase n=1 Tax=Deinococcus terrestris TaxID=2651870 RepID=A0A7X1NWS8_9DEIO|nr:polyphosphate kinase 1 [Deinococcus terrestris]MPY66794.1 polyphosphate kinase 1 [Deinococcus terrestris]